MQHDREERGASSKLTLSLKADGEFALKSKHVDRDSWSRFRYEGVYEINKKGWVIYMLV